MERKEFENENCRKKSWRVEIWTEKKKRCEVYTYRYKELEYTENTELIWRYREWRYGEKEEEI